MKWGTLFLLGILLTGLGCVDQPKELTIDDIKKMNEMRVNSLQVIIQDTHLGYSTIPISAGGTIHFINGDKRAHDIHITRNGEDVFPSTEIGPGDRLDVTMSEPGTYELVCDRHLPEMRVTINVNP